MAAAWLGVMGCGGGKSSDAGDRDHFLAQLCAEYSDCCKAAGRPSDGSQCRAFYGAFAPATGYDQSAAQSCLEEVRASSNKCDGTSYDSPSCSKVFATTSGTAMPGETCEDDSDCAPAASGKVECVSHYVEGANLQKCQVRLPGEAGSTPCVGTIDGNITSYSGTGDDIPAMGYTCDLADGLSCDGQSGACKSLAMAGEACTGGSYQCVPSAYCSFSDRVCKARADLGAACQSNDECKASASCDSASKTCVARHAIGEACDVNADCTTDNCTNQKCGADDDLSLTFLCGSRD